MATEGVDGSSYFASSRSINDIPTEVIDEILFFMDVKTLGRLRCASKWWNARISSPSFCLLHYGRSLHRGCLLLQVCREQRECSNNYNDKYVLSSTNLVSLWHRNLRRLDLPKKTYMVDRSSAFGLIILQISNKLCIYNPTTRSIVVNLPPCNDEAWTHCLALGLVHSTNQFKVVSLCILQLFSCWECRVLTIPGDLRKGWRKVPIHPSVNNFDLVAVSFESAVYTSSFDDKHLFRFDLETELWSEVELPPSVESFTKFLVFQGNPCLVVEKANLRDEVWLLRDSNVWVKKWVLNKSPRGNLFTPLHHDEERGRILMKGRYGALMWYQIETESYEEVHEFQVEYEGQIEPHYIPYVETLASLATLRDIAIGRN